MTDNNMTNNMEKGCMKCGSAPRHNQTDENGSYLCLSCEEKEEIVFGCSNCKTLIIRDSEEHDNSGTYNDEDWFCPDCYKFCDDCEGPCKSKETEACDECGIELPIGCGNNPSDQSIFNGCCDDCREESIDEE